MNNLKVLSHLLHPILLPKIPPTSLFMFPSSNCKLCWLFKKHEQWAGRKFWPAVGCYKSGSVALTKTWVLESLEWGKNVKLYECWFGEINFAPPDFWFCRVHERIVKEVQNCSSLVAVLELMSSPPISLLLTVLLGFFCHFCLSCT